MGVDRARVHGHAEAVFVAYLDAHSAGDAGQLLDGEVAVLARDGDRSRGAAARAQHAEDASIDVEFDRAASAVEARPDLAGVAACGRPRDEVAQRPRNHRHAEWIGHLSAPCS